MSVVVGFGGNIMCLFIGLVFELGLSLFILWDTCVWIFMYFYWARRTKDSELGSLEKEFLMCLNSSFRNMVEQILRALRKKKVNAAFRFIVIRIKIYVVIFVVYFVVNFEF